MLFGKKTAFTLVELLVVMSIIGILAAALTVQVGKWRGTGQAVRCKANLKNLAQAAINYGVDNNRMPWAGSHEWRWPRLENGRYVTMYHERQGWVGWTGSGRWLSRTAQNSSMTPASFYGDASYESITNGALWVYVGKDLGAYVCDVHKGAAKAKKLRKVLRSYVMNGYFGYENKRPIPDWREIRLDAISDRGNAGNLLLFAELPARNIDTSTDAADGVLEAQVANKDGQVEAYFRNAAEEKIGFNHLVSKRYVAHVAFADGHVDVLMEPDGASDQDLKDLTEQLCGGWEIEQKLRDKMN